MILSRVPAATGNKFATVIAPSFSLCWLSPVKYRLYLLVAFLAAPPALGLTLEEILREAATRHPLLAVANARAQAAAGRTLQAGLRPNPLFVYQTEDFRFWQSPSHRFWQDADHFFYLQQTFETASKRARRVDLALANEERAKIEIALQRQFILARVRAAYWDAAGAVQREKLLAERLAAFDEITNYHRIQVREGAMAEADLIRVELEEEKLSQLLTAARIEASKQQIRLAREMGRPDPSAFPLDSPLLASNPVAAHTLEQALAQRAEAQLAVQVHLISRAQATLENALATPNVDGVAGYKRSRTFDTVIWGLQMQLPVNNRNQGNIAAANAEVAAADHAIRSTRALVEAELRGAQSEAQQRQAALSRLSALRDRARQNAEIAQAAYRLGGADLLRLLDAQRSLLDTEQCYLEALISYHQSLAQLDSVAGVMP